MSKQVCYDAMRFSRGGGVVARDMIPHGVRSPVRTVYRTIDSDITNGELVFLTTCGPATTFDPKITGVAGTWFFDDGTTLAAASGAEISKTFAAEGLHRAVYRPVGGLAAITAIAAPSDLIVSISGAQKTKAISIDIWNNPNIVISTYDLPQSTISLTTAENCPIRGPLSVLPNLAATVNIQTSVYLSGSLYDLRNVTTLLANGCAWLTGELSDISRSAIYIQLHDDTGISGSLADLPASLTTRCSLYGCTGIAAGSIAHLVAIRDIRIYSMGWLTADVDTVLLSIANAIVADPNHFTYATPALQIGGTNEAPSGTYQEPTGPGGTPTSGLEAVWIMTHNTGHTWTVAATGGSYP